MSDPSMYNNFFTFSLYISNGTENVKLFFPDMSSSGALNGGDSSLRGLNGGSSSLRGLNGGVSSLRGLDGGCSLRAFNKA